MITFMEAKEMSKDSSERCVDPQLWHACAGGMVQMPAVNSRVFYFPQGHAEHSSSGGHVDFSSAGHVATKNIPPFVLCRVSAVKFLADPDSDEVFARLTLHPEDPSSSSASGEDSTAAGTAVPEKPASFAKTLTQSDANNGGGFSVPRYCAETIFPRLDYSADPPVQTILAKDVHGEVWKFRHIYRGTPRRHLLTTGWSTFVNHKKLVAGDSIVFLRSENGDLCVGIRRAKRGGGWGPETGGRVRPEEVAAAATAVAAGRDFEVGYYPRGGAPEFCVGAAAVRAAAAGRWWTGMRFKMAFETEDSSRISWFMGTVNLVRPADPIRWPDSPWRLLHVSWDEPDLLHNVTRVSPWLVEPVPVSPAQFLHQLSPPRKKLRPSFPAMMMSPTPESFFRRQHETTQLLTPPHPAAGAGMQGARHRYALSMSDLRAHHHHYSLPSVGPARQLVLFGKPILTEQQMMMVDNTAAANAHCKVFVESEDIGRTLDLSLLGSYDELNAKLAEMFEIEDGSDAIARALYRDSTGASKHIGDEPFSDFTKTARRLTIPTDSRRHSA